MKANKFYTDEQKEIFSFIKIIIVIIVLIVLVFLFTKYVVNNENKYENKDVKGSINYNEVYLGAVLSKADAEYYVLVFDSDNINNTYIINKSSEYKSKEGSVPLYTADLKLELNKSFISSTESYDDSDISLLKVSGTTLIKVKDKKIVKFISEEEKIIAELN